MLETHIDGTAEIALLKNLVQDLLSYCLLVDTIENILTEMMSYSKCGRTCCMK